MSKQEQSSGRATRLVSKELFQQVYDSPHSLPGKDRWATRDEDVREIERLLGLEPRSIGAPLWVSGDTRHCPECNRETNWLDIVSSALSDIHSQRMLAQVILGDRKFVNIEAPRVIADLACYGCKRPVTDLRSFKCHNWAYAIGKLRDLNISSSRWRPGSAHPQTAWNPARGSAIYPGAGLHETIDPGT